MTAWKARLQAAGIHLAVSSIVAVLAATLVFSLWYPYPYREISGGSHLFMLVVLVDAVLGPLLTLTVFDRRKPRHVLRRDLTFVGLLQAIGLAYGLWTVAQARPIHLVFEIDRFYVVHAVDVPQQLVSMAPHALQTPPWGGPTLLSLRPFKDNAEQFEATMMALQGVEPAARPDLWQTYAAGHSDVLRAGKPLAQLQERFAGQSAQIDKLLAETGRKAEQVLYVPMTGRQFFWTVLVDASSAQVLGFLPLDSY